MGKRKHNNRVVWIDRGWQPIDIGFCPSKKAWDREIRCLNGTQPWPEAANRGGHTLLGENDLTGVAVILVSVGRCSERDAHEVIMTIVHEAVHVWQFLCRQIGETSPGIEMEAYGIEHIAAQLIHAYATTQGRGKKWLTA